MEVDGKHAKALSELNIGETKVPKWCVENERSYLGSEVDSDHNLVVMKQSVKLNKLKTRRKKLQWDLHKLEAKAESFQSKVNEKIRDTKQNDVSIEGRWKMLEKAVLEAAKTEGGYKMAT